MRLPPSKRIDKDAIRAWRLFYIILSILPILITIALFVLANLFNFSYWFGIGFLCLTIIESTITIVVIPKIRWKRWRYEIFDQEIYIQHGIFIVSQTLVPMIRVQHVDTKQDPILKKYGLASLTVYTAATTHEIPALSWEEASNLRDLISERARVEEDDV